MNRVIAVIDTIEGRIQPPSLEILTFAREVASVGAAPIEVVLAGHEVKDEAQGIASRGFQVTCIEHPGLRLPHPELLGRLLIRHLADALPCAVCLAHTMRSCHVASILSTATGIPAVTAVKGFEMAEGSYRFMRSIFNGKIEAVIQVARKGFIVTVESGMYPPPDSDAALTGEVKHYPLQDIDNRTHPIALSEPPSSNIRLEEADVIVAVGRGVGSKEHIHLAASLARLFRNAAIGASRPVCDNRWLPCAHQVGVTGRSVAPKLYIALGISGSSQHIAGMKNAQCVVSINRDPDAAMHSVADYIVVEDLHTFIPILIDTYREWLRSGGG